MFGAVVVALTVVLVAGCASEAVFERGMRSWLGSNIKEFMSAYCPASSIVTERDEELYSFDFRTRKCKVIWHVNKQKVMTRFTHEGNDCTANPISG